MDPRADGYVGVWLQQDDPAVLVGRAEREDLGHERADLSRREVHHRDDEQTLFGVSVAETRAFAMKALERRMKGRDQTL